MLNVILDKPSILMYQNIFDELITQKLQEHHDNVIGFPVGARQEIICYSKSLGMWYTTSMDIDGTERVWNSFGLQNPYEIYNLNIAVEINFPFSRKGDVNGVFLKDEDGNVYVGHRGLVNISGRKSIKKIYNQYFGSVQECNDSGRNSEVTWSHRQSYRVEYRTNLKKDYRVWRDNLLTTVKYELSVSGLKLAENEYVTDVVIKFGTVEPGFREKDAPYISARVLDTLEHETRIVNKSDAGGKCGDEWAYDTDIWVTIAQAKPKKPLPKTGF